MPGPAKKLVRGGVVHIDEFVDFVKRARHEADEAERSAREAQLRAEQARWHAEELRQTLDDVWGVLADVACGKVVITGMTTVVGALIRDEEV